MMRAMLQFTVVLTIMAFASSTPAAGGPSNSTSDTAAGEWRYYGGDGGSTKYSPLDQIHADNVAKVKVAWIWNSPDLPLQRTNRLFFSFAYENTPLMAAGRLYASTSL